MTMTNKSDQGEGFAHADAFFAECTVVEDFIARSVRPIVDRTVDRGRPDHVTYLGALLRITAWLRSLQKLNHPGDFQPVITGSRALFEISVDLTLLHYDGIHHSHDMMIAWEQSAKLKYAEGIERFYADADIPVPAEHAGATQFIAQHRGAVDALRLRYWPNRRNKAEHRERWTGRNLRDDAHEADRLNSSGFGEFYAMRFSHLCWATHGSGFVALRSISESSFPGLSGLGFAESVRFALVGAEMVLRLFGKYDAVTEERLRRLESERRATRTRVFATYPAAWASIGMGGSPA